jgi:hypothetical protein
VTQPMPVPGKENVTPALIVLLEQRQERGIAKYGTPLQTHNGRDALWDALEEAIDLAQYLMQAIMERDSAIKPIEAP